MGWYSTSVLADSPSGYWKLDEISGTSANDEISTNDGTYWNTPTLGASPLAPDMEGSAVSCLAASSQFIHLPNNTLSTNGSFELWFSWTAGEILFRDNTSAGGTGWFAGNVSNVFTVRIGGTTNISCGPTTAYRDGARHHLVITKTGANAVVYLDGAVVGTSAAASNTSSVSPWHVCKNGGNADYTTATVDEVAVYSAALSAARVSAHYTSGSAPVVESVSERTNASSVDMVGDLPSGVVAGNLLVAHVVADGTATINAAPTDWNILGPSQLSSSDHRSAMYWKWATGSEPATYTWTLSTANINRVTILRISGAWPASPIADASSASISASSLALPALTPFLENNLLIGAWAADTASSARTFSTPPGMTQAAHENDASGLLNMVAYANIGTTSPSPAYSSSLDTGTDALSAQVALIRPLPNPGALLSGEAFGTPSLHRFAGPIDTTKASATGTSIAGVVPAAVTTGTVMVALFVAASTTGVLAAPAGWTTALSEVVGGVSKEVEVYYRVADGTDVPGAATGNFTSSGTGALQLSITALTGIDTTNPLIGVVSRLEATAQSKTQHPVDARTLATPNNSLVLLLGVWSQSVTASARPDYWMESNFEAGDLHRTAVMWREKLGGNAGVPYFETSANAAATAIALAFNAATPGTSPGTPSQYIGFSGVEVIGSAKRYSDSSVAISVPIPAGTRDGDLMIAVRSKGAISGGFSTPAGWTAVANRELSGSGNEVTIYAKVATPQDLLDEDMYFTGDATSRNHTAIVTFRGTAKDGSVLGTAHINQATSTAHSLDASAVSPLEAALAIFVETSTNQDFSWVAPPSGFTEAFSNTTDPTIEVAYDAVEAGSLGVLSWTVNESSQSLSFVTTFTRDVQSPITSAESFGTGSISNSGGGANQNVSPAGISSAEAFGTAKFVVYLVASAIGSGEALGSATVDLQDLIQPTGIASQEAFGSATADYPYSINPAGNIASEEAFGTTTLDSGESAYPTGIASGEFVSDPSLIIDQTVSPAAFTGGEAFGGASVALDQEIDPAGISSAQVVSTPTIDTSATGSPLSKPILRYYGSPLEEIFFDTGSYSVASRSFYDDPSLLFTGIPSGETFGIAFVEGGDKIILATGIPGAEDFGAFIFEFVVYPPSIPSGEAFGTPGTPQVISLDGDGIASSEAFGSLSVTSLIRVSAGIPSVASVSTPQIFISRSGGNSPWPKTQQWSVYLAYSNRFSPATIGQPVTIAELVHAQGFKLDMILNRPGSLSMTTIMDDERAQYITPVNTALIAVRDGIVRWSGPVWTVDRDYAAGTINVSAVGWLEMLEHRRLRADIPEITSNDDLRVAEIFSAINAQTSSQGALLPAPLVYGGHFGSTQSRYHQEHSSGQQMGQLIHELIEIENGFDVKVDPVTRVMTTHRELIYSGFSSSHLWTADDYATAGSWYGESLVHFESWIPTASGTITLQPPLVDPADAGPNQDYYIFEGEAPDRIGTPMVDVFLADAWADGLSANVTDTFDVVAGQIYTVAFANYGGMAAVGDRGSLSEWIGSIEDFGGAPEDVNSSYEIRGYGSDRPEAYFGYNVGPDNLSGFTQNIDASELANTVNAVGDKGNTVSVDDNESLVRYGCFEEDFSMTGTGIGPEAEQRLTVGAAAEVFFRKEPRNTYNITPKSWTEGGSVPRLFDDYDIGDIIRFGARRSSFVIPEDLDAGGVQYARVFGVTVSVDQNGNEAISSLKLANA